MEGNVYQPGSSPGAVVVKKPAAAPAEPERYQTGKGCLMLGLVLAVSAAVLVLAILLWNEQPGLM